jgi:hypothetical protein
MGIPKTVQEFEKFRSAILQVSDGTEEFKTVLDYVLSQNFPQFKSAINETSDAIGDSIEENAEELEKLQKSLMMLLNLSRCN